MTYYAEPGSSSHDALAWAARRITAVLIVELEPAARLVVALR
jgi:hypothetical protein